mmetsp:Transcript_19449/g.31956  ORF Transcript_19449/g.31956 Transcript_19449/m.31956 type:complete len:323 (+) Transcript_19449:60-1028(+)
MGPSGLANNEAVFHKKTLRTSSCTTMSSTMTTEHFRSDTILLSNVHDSSKSSHQKQQHLPSQRRRLKSALFFAYRASSIATALLFLTTVFSKHPTVQAFSTGDQPGLSQRKHAWVTRSVEYYSTVLRRNNEKPTQMMDSVSGAMEHYDPLNDKNFVELATKHYYARHLIKNGKLTLAEKIYRKIINELEAEGSEEDCDHAKLAVSTLLLALHMQRYDDIKATRAVFVNFFRRVAVSSEEDEVKCSCSAKVLQAYALFEMKNGHSAKSLEIIQKAVKMDEDLRPVLGWKQFRDAAAGREYRPIVSFRRQRVKKLSTASSHVAF